MFYQQKQCAPHTPYTVRSTDFQNIVENRCRLLGKLQDRKPGAQEIDMVSLSNGRKVTS